MILASLIITNFMLLLIVGGLLHKIIKTNQKYKKIEDNCIYVSIKYLELSEKEESKRLDFTKAWQ